MPADTTLRPRPAPYRPLFGLERHEGWRPRPPVRLEDFTITAAADGATASRWNAVLVVEGVRTTDHREIGVGALAWRTLPLPLMGLDRTSWGHDGAELAGKIESITHVDNRYEAAGTFLATEPGQRFAGYVADQALRWVSVDLEVRASEFIEVYTDGGGDPWDECMPMPSDWWERITDASLMGATVCPFPAFPQAVIVPDGMAFPAVEPDNGLPTMVPAMAAAGVAWDDAVAVPEHPPAAWFTDPKLTRLTHVHSPEPGRIVGHLAGWYTPHIGYSGSDVFAPRSPSMGERFCTARGVECDDGTRPVTGRLTLGTTHADLGLTARPASDHYDHTGTAVADVVYGEDEHGAWVAGAVRPGTTLAQLRTLLSSDVSGDWRAFGDQLDIVAVLVVNVAGFPVPALAAAAGPSEDLEGPPGAQAATLHHGARVLVTAEGQTLALVAAGVIGHDPAAEALARFGTRLAAVERTLAGIAPAARQSAAAALYQRLTSPRPG